MIKVTIPLIPAGQDGPLIPAAQVTALLRTIAVDWVRAAEDAPDPGVDRQTVDNLAGVLDELADSIEVECIALASAAGGGDPDAAP
ncbi:DUF6213 family protein [Streptomyces sp. NPDC002033]|uniref:DUF6213 family protein n=1 Tax=unclassified Streptomyces TaxID=2593676 RepID=UPI00331747B5